MTHVISYLMKISIPQLAAKYVYPALRRRLVEILYHKKKMNQLEIARLLGISQSAVSRYVEGNRGVYIDVSRFKDIEQELEKLADAIVDENMSIYDIQLELARITMVFLGKGYACNLHSRIDKSIDPSKCRSCLILFKDYVEAR